MANYVCTACPGMARILFSKATRVSALRVLLLALFCREAMTHSSGARLTIRFVQWLTLKIAQWQAAASLVGKNVESKNAAAARGVEKDN